MSITTSSLLLYIFCLSFHVCNARHLGAITKESDKQSLLSSKSDEKVGPVNISISGPKVKPTLWNDELGVGNGEKMLKESEVREDDNSKPIHLKADQKELKDHNRVKLSGYAAQSESLASVSWPVPHRKRKEQQPEFNSDYSIPKTHPPVHN